MSRKSNNVEYTRGYAAGFSDRSQRTIEYNIRYWCWSEWFLYVFATLVVAAVALAIFGLLTLWISWASDHHGHPYCYFTPDGVQWCTDGR